MPGISWRDALQASSFSVGFGAAQYAREPGFRHGDFEQKIKRLGDFLPAWSEQFRPRTIGPRASEAKPQSGHLCLLYENLSVVDLSGV